MSQSTVRRLAMVDLLTLANEQFDSEGWSVEQSRTYFDLLEACSKPGCPVCRVVLEAVEHSIDSMNYEFVNDPEIRLQIESAWGFCNTHAQQWLVSAHPLGTALIYDAVLKRISKQIRQVEPNSKAGLIASLTTRLNGRKVQRQTPDREQIAPSAPCSLCRYRDDQERLVTSALLIGLQNPAFAIAYDASSAVCFPHFRQAIDVCTDLVAFEKLKDRALAVEQQLSLHLKEIVRKHDHRFSKEPTGEERGATERAVRHVAGSPGIPDR